MNRTLAYVPLHVHSEYSLLDGSIRLGPLARRCRELGMASCALTDHGNLHGAVEFHDACIAEGVKPVLGCELYVAPGSRFDRPARSGPEASGHHLVLLARDAEGWSNLVKLSTAGHLEGFHHKPRVDRALLAAHSRGLTCLSGCLAGEVADHLLRGEEPRAREAAAFYRDVFGAGRYFLEVQDHGLAAEKSVHPGLGALSRELGVPLVATPDCHYLLRDDAAAHEVLLCIQAGTHLGDPHRPRFEGSEYYLKDDREMRELFAWAPQAVDATAEIAAECVFSFPEARLRLPEFEVPPSAGGAEGYLRTLCLAALPRLYPGPEAVQARERLERELGVIGRLGYAGYFLIVADFVAAARRMGVRVGPGRGSAAGSLVSRLLGITAADPLARGLLFERFLNPERVSPPDIDVDFADRGRDRVIDYVVGRYGRERVAQIIAFGRLAARAAVRDVGRALDLPPSEVDALAKLVPAEPDMTLERALEQVPELKAAARGGNAARLLSAARPLEGLARHASTHAAGVVIGPRPLAEDVPLCLGGAAEGGVVTQFDMASLERLGLVKMDFLGLRTLTVLDEACRLAQEAGETVADLDALPDGDPGVFAMLSRGESHGVFQLESAGMRDLLRRFKPAGIEDLDQLIALFRPGPMRMIDEYLGRREGRLPVRVELPELEPILRGTQGIFVYQEQVMRAAMDVAGFSAGEADLLRRAMGKKDAGLLERQRRAFLEGCASRKVPAPKAAALFDTLARFAEYGFNKAHSASYALLAYQTAWLKARHPGAFLAAVLGSEMGDPERTRAGLAEARAAGWDVLGPDVNASAVRFRAEGRALRFGLAAVRHVGEAAVEGLVREREAGGPFTSLRDVLERCGPGLAQGRAVEHLIKSGAFDSLDPRGMGSRAALLRDLPRAAAMAARAREERVSGQGSLFGEGGGTSPGDEAEAVAWTEAERLAYEKEALGLYLSGHPLGRWAGVLRALGCLPLDSLGGLRDGAEVRIGGVVQGMRRQETRRGGAMARLELEDLGGSCEVLVWPKVLEASGGRLARESRVLVRGRLEQGGDGLRVSAEEVSGIDEALARAAELTVRLKGPPGDGADGLRAWALAHPGPVVLSLALEEGGRLVLQRSRMGVLLDGESLGVLDGLGLEYRIA